jgi:hypothetical protein
MHLEKIREPNAANDLLPRMFHLIERPKSLKSPPLLHPRYRGLQPPHPHPHPPRLQPQRWIRRRKSQHRLPALKVFDLEITRLSLSKRPPLHHHPLDLRIKKRNHHQIAVVVLVHLLLVGEGRLVRSKRRLISSHPALISR